MFEPAPLGAGEGARPLLYRSVAAAGDVILLCSSTVGRLLAHQGKAGRQRRDEALRAGQPEPILDVLERVVAASDIDDAFALVVALGDSVGGRIGGRRLAPPAWPFGSIGGWTARRPSAPPADPHEGEALTARPAARSRQRPAAPPPRVREPAAARVERRPATAGRGRRITTRVVLPDRVRDGLLAAIEAVMPRRSSLQPALSSRQQTLATPGIGSIQRHREPGGLPAEWHANLPRGVDVHLPGRALAVGLAVLVALGGTRFYVQQQQARQEPIDAAIVQLDDALRMARDDPAHRQAAVVDAQAAFDAALRAGADGAALGDRAQILAKARSDAWDVEQLTNLTLVGAIPAAMDGESPHLMVWGDWAYLVGGGVYQIDPAGRQLIRMLAPGDAIDGRTVDPIAAAAADGDGLVAADDASTFVWTPDGHWTASPLASLADASLGAAPVAAYGDALYALDPGGRIVKFGIGANAEASVWAASDTFPDLTKARDLAVDGSVHVLLGDGRVLTFFQHALKSSVLPEVTPPLAQPAYLAQMVHSGALYIVDPPTRIGGSAGRLVRVGADGAARQFILPGDGPGASRLARAQDVAVDERSGSVYLVADGQLWQATLPPTTTAIASAAV
jgi:hypothetical protein